MQQFALLDVGRLTSVRQSCFGRRILLGYIFERRFCCSHHIDRTKPVSCDLLRVRCGISIRNCSHRTTHGKCPTNRYAICLHALERDVQTCGLHYTFLLRILIPSYVIESGTAACFPCQFWDERSAHCKNSV
jgi:hypothetical protein